MDKRSPILAAALALAACGNDPAAPAANSAAPAAEAPPPAGNSAAPKAAALEASAGAEIEATSAGISVGDHIWADFAGAQGAAAPEPALIDEMAIAAFLKAHEGQRVSVRIETSNRLLDPPGEQMDVRVVTAARSGATTAEAWWGALTAAQQRAAERGVWEAGSGG